VPVGGEGDGDGDGDGDGLLEVGVGVGVALACGEVELPAEGLDAPELGGAELAGLVAEALGVADGVGVGVGVADGGADTGGVGLPDPDGLPDTDGLTAATDGTLATAADCPSGGASSKRTTPTAAIQIAVRQ
jgi:hypothetical protein